MLNTLTKMSDNLLEDIEDFHKLSPKGMANTLLQFWTPECCKVEIGKKPLYCPEEITMIKVAIGYMRCTIQCIRKDKRVRIRKHMLASIPEGFWNISDEKAQEICNDLLKQFNI